MQTSPFRKRLMTFSVGVPQTVCSFASDFVALEIMEPEVGFHDDNFWKFHVPYACTSGACALETRLNEEKKKKERKPKPKPRPHCLGKKINFKKR